MRWLSRNHGITIRYLYDRLGNEETKDDTQLMYTRSQWMVADIYTNSFNNGEKWRQASELVNVIDPISLKEVFARRAAILNSLKYDQTWHPINKKPQAGNSATNRKWVESQTQWFASEKN